METIDKFGRFSRYCDCKKITDFQNKRLTNVGDAVNDGDAVNLRTLREEIERGNAILKIPNIPQPSEPPDDDIPDLTRDKKLRDFGNVVLTTASIPEPDNNDKK